MSPFESIQDRIFSGAEMFSADIELRRILLAKDRKPIPFISVLNFGLPLLADAKSVASQESNPSLPET